MSIYLPQPVSPSIETLYQAIQGYGGVQWAAPIDGTEPNQFVYDDDSLLVGADAGTVVYDQDGEVPNLAEKNGRATFDASADKINFTVPAGDELQMSGGGTFMALVTCGPTPLYGQWIIHKTSGSGVDTRDGYELRMHKNNGLVFISSDSATTASVLSSASGIHTDGQRALVAATLDGAGNGKLYYNGAIVGSLAGMEIPSDTTTPMVVGNSIGLSSTYTNGNIELVTMIPGIVLTEAQVKDLAELAFHPTFFPPQKVHGELDSVYDTIHKLGGDLYIPPTHAGGVNQFVRADETVAPLVGETDPPAGVFVAANSDNATIEEALITQFPFTVAGWFNTSNATSQTIFFCGDKDISAAFLALRVTSGSLVAYQLDGALDTDIYPASLDDGENHHITLVGYIDGLVSKYALYVDGVFADTLANANWNSSFWADIAADRTALGISADSSPNTPFDGNLWNWQVYDGHQADAADALLLYNGGKLSNPTAIWKFDDGSGVTVADSSGNSNDLTYNGDWYAGVTFDQGGGIDGILGGSPRATFAAAADVIDFGLIVTTDPIYMTAGGTWCFVVTSDLSGTFASLNQAIGTVRGGWEVRTASNGAIHLVTSGTTTTVSVVYGPADSVADGERFFCTVTQAAGGEVKIYKNVTLVKTGSAELPSPTTGSYLAVSSRGRDFTNPLIGNLELVALIPGIVLTQPQIATIAAQCGRLG